MRWLKFYAVGAMGAALQLAALAMLVRAAGMHYLAATALAVEAAILHNFLWHWRWTWDDRRNAHPATALVRFNLTNGLVSISGSLLAAVILTGIFDVNSVVANAAAIAAGSIANFLLSDRVVFVPPASGNRPRRPAE